ncbi:hypothetical protein BDC45DRAFT_540264 [Circinella umbellata]|nr:hypothetical protein BDC45DRAFT_540264 [Circinella umbellata]
MSNMQTFTGWTSFEIGHLTTQYDQNFVIYTNPNENATGLNCKIRAIDLVQSNVYKYLAQGGLCQVTVRGIMYVAPQSEQGWIPTSMRYLQVSFIMQEQELLSDEEEEESKVTTTIKQQRQQSTTSFTNGSSKDITKKSQCLNEDEDDDDDSDLDYDSIDVEEEERLHRNDPEYNDYDDSMEESDISSEDIDKLIAAAKEPLDLNYIKKRDAEDFLENRNNKKHKQNHSPPHSSIIIDSD